MSYDEGINLIFDYCVELLIIAAQSIGMTYEEINVWFFIVFEPRNRRSRFGVETRSLMQKRDIQRTMRFST